MRRQHQVREREPDDGFRQQHGGTGRQPGLELAVLLRRQLHRRGQDRFAFGSEQWQQVFARFGAQRGGDQTVLPRVLDGVDDGAVDGDGQAFRVAQTLLDALQELRRRTQRDRLGQRRLVPELVVDGLPAHPGPRRDVRHAQRRVAAVRQQVGGRVEQGLSQ